MLKKLRYFASVTGALSGLSLFFPFANRAVDIICIDPQFQNVAVFLAPLVCAFLIFFIFTAGPNRWDPLYAVFCFGFGIFLVVAQQFFPEDFCVGGYSLYSYITTFVSFTVAFALLAVYNYYTE